MESSNNDDRRSRTPEQAAEKTAEIVSNMALAHELVMNDKFQFHDFPDNSIEKHVKEIVHKAFWDKLREDLESDPPVYTHALNLLVELKETLLGILLPQHKSLRSQINEFIDVELIKQQIEHNALDLRQYAQAVVSILSKLCAPIRDEQVQGLLNVTGIVDMFREIFKVIDLMKMDMANYQLQALKPQLLQQSVEYERTKFKQYLETNPDGLMSTKVWLNKGKEVASVAAPTSSSPSSTPLSSSPSASSPLSSSPSASSPLSSSPSSSSHDVTDSSDKKHVDVLTHAYLGIIFGEPGWPYPETLIMDELRLAEMRSNVHRTTLLGSILLVTMQTVARQLKGDAVYLKELKQDLIILLDGVPEGDITPSMSGIYEQVKKETNKFLGQRGYPEIPQDQETLLKGQITALGDPNHQLRKLLSKRAHDFMFNVVRTLLHRSSSQKKTQQPIPAGLEPVFTELSELALRFARLVSHNAMTFWPFYHDIFKHLDSSKE